MKRQGSPARRNEERPSLTGVARHDKTRREYRLQCRDGIDKTGNGSVTGVGFVDAGDEDESGDLVGVAVVIDSVTNGCDVDDANVADVSGSTDIQWSCGVMMESVVNFSIGYAA